MATTGHAQTAPKMKLSTDIPPEITTPDSVEPLMDAKSLWLTANTDTVYAPTWLDLKNGRMLVESPPNTLGILDDFRMQYVTGMGNAGRDKAQQGV
jgi:hypothetical protein